MNDAELDELLKTWKAPQPREAWREKVRAGIEVQSRPAWQPLTSHWKLWATLAATLVLAAALVSPDAFSARVHVPYTVDSQITHYEQRAPSPPPYGSRTSRFPLIFPRIWGNVLLTSYNDAGSEVILSWLSPDHRLNTALWKARLAISGAIDRVTAILQTPDQEAGAFAQVYPENAVRGMIVGRREDLLSSGCRTSHGGSRVIGEEVILDYPTTAIQQAYGGGRFLMTLWMAPELGCFALRATIQAKQADGSWMVISEKKALSVTVNP